MSDAATTETVAPAGDTRPNGENGRPPRRNRGVVGVLFRFQSLFGLVLVALVALLFPIDGEQLFFQPDNLLQVVRDMSEIGIMAVGMTLVIIIGGIDLSVGAVLGLAATGVAALMVNDNVGWVPAVLLVLAIGLVFGVLQGIASALFGIQAFIVTLAGMQIARGIARIWSGGQGVPIAYGDGPGEASETFSLLGEKATFPFPPFGDPMFTAEVPIPALIFAVVAILAIVFLRTSAISRHIYAIGGNEKAARLSGVPVVRVKVIVFGVCGLLAALAGIIHAGQLNQGSPNDGSTYELDAIAAVVIGGTSLSGGRGSVVGTVAGALMLGALNNFLRLHGVDSNIQLLVKGLVIVVVAGLMRLRPAA